jgi:hemoglobin-like flavoprotein
MSRCKLRTPRPIHFKLGIAIGIDSLMVCILFGEIPELWERKFLQILYECWRRVYHALLAQLFISIWILKKVLIVKYFQFSMKILKCYFLVKFRFFIEELWERKSLQILYECWRRAYHALLAQLFIHLYHGENK